MHRLRLRRRLRVLGLLICVVRRIQLEEELYRQLTSSFFLLFANREVGDLILLENSIFSLESSR
jgi:hypothetical protein